MRDLSHHLRPYTVALLATAGALFVTCLVAPLSERLPFALFIAAVVLSAWRGGLASGLVATGLAALALFGRWHFQHLPDPEYLPRIGMFALIGVLASCLSRMCRRAVEEADWIHVTLGNVLDAVIFTDPEGRVTFLNPTAQTLTGWDDAAAAELPLERVFCPLHEDTRQPLENPIAHVLRAGQQARSAAHTLLLSQSGTAHPIEYRAAPIRDGSGSLVGVILVFRDVSDRRAADLELRRSEERYRLLAATVPTGLFLMDPTGRCIYTNAACQATCGFTHEESLGEGWARVLHAEDRDQVVSDWVSAVLEGVPYRGSFRCQTLPGGVRWLELRATPLRSEQGTLLGHVGIVEDIAERKQAEHTLAETRTLLRALGEAVPDAVSVKDPHGRYVLINSMAACLLGKAPEEILGLTDAEVLPTADAGPIMERDRQVLATERAQTSEEIEKAPGYTRTYLATRSPYRDAHGKVAGLIALARDITEERRADDARLEADNRLSLFLEHLPGPAFLKDADGRHLLVNETYAQLWHGQADDWRGKSNADLLPAALAERFRRDEDTVLETEEIVESREDIDGGEEPCHWLLRRFPIRDREGTVIQVGGIGVDLTAQRRAEHTLQRAHQEADARLQARTAELSRAHAQVQEKHEKTLQQVRAEYEARIQQTRAELDSRLQQRAAESAKTDLESRVQQRTAELTRANAALTEQLAERQRNEEALRDSQTHFQALFDNTPALLYLKDAHGRYLLINRSLKNAFHLGKKQIAGKTDAELFPRDLAEAFQANDRQVFAAHSPLQFEEALPREHEAHTYLMAKAPLYDGAGKVSGLCGVALDITDRKRAEEEARQQAHEKGHKQAHEEARKHAQEEQQRLAKESGNQAEELRRQAAEAAEEARRLRERIDQAERTRNDEQQARLLHEQTARAEVEQARQRLRELEEDHQRLREQQEAHHSAALHRTRAITHGLGTAVCTVDREGHVTALNPAGESLLGWREAELHGKDLRQVLRPAGSNGDWTGVADALTAVLQFGRPARDLEQVFARKDGSIFTAQFALTPIVVHEQVEGAVLTIEDVTERKLRAAELARQTTFQKVSSELLENDGEESELFLEQEVLDWLSYN